MNGARAAAGKSKVSYTHLIGWAILKALEENPGLNHAYGEINGQPARTCIAINLGIAVDVAGKDGARSLKVPNIKDAGALNFKQYLTAYDDIVTRLVPINFWFRISREPPSH